MEGFRVLVYVVGNIYIKERSNFKSMVCGQFRGKVRVRFVCG